MKLKRFIAAAAISAVFALSGCGTSAYVADRAANNAAGADGTGYANNTDTVQNGKVYKSRFATNALRSTGSTTSTPTATKKSVTTAKRTTTPARKRVINNAVTVPYRDTSVNTTTNGSLNRLTTNAVGGTARSNVKSRGKIRYANNGITRSNPLSNLANSVNRVGRTATYTR
jgi:hypothetical protein